MDIDQKRTFVQSAIQKADDALIETLYQELDTDSVLKQMLTRRASRAEDDTKHERLMDIHTFKEALVPFGLFHASY